MIKKMEQVREAEEARRNNGFNGGGAKSGVPFFPYAGTIHDEQK